MTSPPAADRRLRRLLAAQRDIACAPGGRQAVIQLIAAVTHELFDGSATSALVAMVEHDLLVGRAKSGDFGPPMGTAVPLASTLMGEAVRTGETQLCIDAYQDPRTDNDLNRRSRTRSSVIAPLVHEGTVIGIVAALSAERAAFDADDVELLQGLADVAAARIAFALTRAHVREREHRLAASQRLAGLASWDYEPATRRIQWSPDLLDMLRLEGCPTYDDFIDRVEPSDRGVLTKAIDKALAEKGSYVVDVRFTRGDSVVRRLRTWGEAVLDEATGEPTMWGCVQDVTEIRETVEAWQESEERFRLAFEHAPIGIVITDLRPGRVGQFIRVNQAYADLLGYAVAELQTMTYRDVTHPEDLPESDGKVSELHLGTRQRWSTSKRYLRKDGTTMHALVNTSAVHDVAGRPQYLVTQVVDVTERVRVEAELERMALTDSLTGLANRVLFSDRLRHALERLGRDGGHLAVLLLDLDRFKLVNDTLGHQAGDALLVEVAARLRQVTRADTTVARLGGDEFVLLAEGLAHPGDAHRLAQRILEALREPFAIIGGADFVVGTGSIGVALASHTARPPEELMREADLALYRAKDAGRNCYALFDDDLRARAVGRMEAERRLRRAVDDGGVVGLLQPIVCLRTGHIMGAEMLARLDDPGAGLQLPAHWVEVAEDTGLIADIDALMAMRCAEVAARWAQAADGEPRVEGLRLRDVALNVSAMSLEQPRFLAAFRAALSKHPVPAPHLRVELSERTLLSGSPATMHALAELRGTGVKLGLDDFGTGYSALSYLERFPLDFIKIDRSFVMQLGQSKKAAAIVGAIIDLAHGLGLSVDAEGVEHSEQLGLLRALGCDRAQGYLFGRPMALANLEELAADAPLW